MNRDDVSNDFWKAQAKDAGYFLLRTLLMTTIIQTSMVAVATHSLNVETSFILIFVVMLICVGPTFLYVTFIDMFVAIFLRNVHNRIVSRFGQLPVGPDHVCSDFSKTNPTVALRPETKAWMKQTLRGYYGLHLPTDGWSDDLLSHPPIFRIWFSNEADRLAFAMKYNIYTA
jgi:hypothetical protein